MKDYKKKLEKLYDNVKKELKIRVMSEVDFTGELKDYWDGQGDTFPDRVQYLVENYEERALLPAVQVGFGGVRMLQIKGETLEVLREGGDVEILELSDLASTDDLIDLLYSVREFQGDSRD